MTYVLDRLGELLQEVPEHAQRARGAGGRRAGSPASIEQIGASAALRPFVEQARAFAGIRMMVAEEHVGTLGGLARQETAIYSVYSVGRVVTELSARAWWLLEPGIRARRRAGRAVADRLYSIHEQTKLVPEGHGEPLEEAERKKAELRERAADAGFEPEFPPPTTDLANRLMHDEGDEDDFGAFTYRLLSAYSHGTLYAINRMVQPLEGVESDELGTITAHTTTTATQEADALLLAMLPFMRAASRAAHYSGWGDEDYGRHLDGIIREVKRARQLAERLEE